MALPYLQNLPDTTYLDGQGGRFPSCKPGEGAEREVPRNEVPEFSISKGCDNRAERGERGCFGSARVLGY